MQEPAFPVVLLNENETLKQHWMTESVSFGQDAAFFTVYMLIDYKKGKEYMLL